MEGYLVDPKNTIKVLKKYKIRFQKKYGQNFLIDGHVMEKIISSAGITKDDCVLEIGPGIGTMTQFLCEAAGRVLAIEIDRAFAPVLSDTLAAYKNVFVIFGDVLKQDIKGLSEEYNGGRPFKVVANLPYYITTPIIMGLLENGGPVENITVMVQKEVAARLLAEPGCKAYGALTLAASYYAEARLCANVPPNCFIPRPNVASAVVMLARRDKPPVEVKDEKLMFKLIRASFQQRRKTLANGIRNSGELDYKREDIEAAIEKAGLPAQVRGETLSLSQFAALSDIFWQMFNVFS